MIFNTLARYFLKRYLITAIWFVIGVSSIMSSGVMPARNAAMPAFMDSP